MASLTERLGARAADNESLRHQLDWLKRQLFGRHSEKRLECDLSEQADPFESLGVDETPARDIPTEEISYRRRRKRHGDAVNESGLRFDDSVPVTTIEVKDPAVESIPEVERVVVVEKATYRLTQRSASTRCSGTVPGGGAPGHRGAGHGAGASERAGADVGGREPAGHARYFGCFDHWPQFGTSLIAELPHSQRTDSCSKHLEGV